jgi:hypothetical protein
MDSPTENINKPTTSFISRVMEFDVDTKNNIMNGIQYSVLVMLPIALTDVLCKHLFSNNNPNSKGSIELLAEITSQAFTIMLLVFLIHKTIVAVPTYSGSPMTRLNYSTFMIGYLLAAFASNHGSIGDKFGVLLTRLDESWSGKKNVSKTKGNNGNVSVSKPISGSMQSMPTHQVSRADYLNTPGQMPPVQNNSPPPLVPHGTPKPPPTFQNEVSNNQDMYGGPSNSMIGTDFPTNQEPMAANGALGGGGGGPWSQW